MKSHVPAADCGCSLNEWVEWHLARLTWSESRARKVGSVQLPFTRGARTCSWNLNGGFKARSEKSNYRRAGSAGPRKIRLFLNLLRHGSILAPVGCRNRMNLLRLESHTRAVRVSRAEC